MHTTATYHITWADQWFPDRPVVTWVGQWSPAWASGHSGGPLVTPQVGHWSLGWASGHSGGPLVTPQVGHWSLGWASGHSSGGPLVTRVGHWSRRWAIGHISVAYPGVRDNRSTINTKTGYDDDDQVGHWSLGWVSGHSAGPPVVTCSLQGILCRLSAGMTNALPGVQ